MNIYKLNGLALFFLAGCIPQQNIQLPLDGDYIGTISETARVTTIKNFATQPDTTYFNGDNQQNDFRLRLQGGEYQCGFQNLHYASECNLQADSIYFQTPQDLPYCCECIYPLLGEKVQFRVHGAALTFTLEYQGEQQYNDTDKRYFTLKKVYNFRKIF